MQRPCDSCGETYEAKRRTSKFCSDRCRVRGSRGALAAVRDLPLAEPPAGEARALVSAVERELVAADRLDSALGQAARALAVRIESGVDTGAAVASLTKELRATLAEATKGVAPEESALDRLRRMRAESLSRGA